MELGGMTMGRISETLGGIAVVLALLGLWSLVTAFGLVSPVFLPPVGDILSALVDLAEDGSLARAVIGTGGRMLLGFGLASLVGCGLGLLTGLSLRARAYVEPSLEFLRPLPASAIIPVAVFSA
jgi:sulfonate transport system permease protein